MVLALWVIAACQIIRLLQNAWQLKMLRHDSSGRDNAYSEFVKSLHDTDAEFVKKMMKEFEKEFDQAKAAKDFRDVVVEYVLPYEREKES